MFFETCSRTIGTTILKKWVSVITLFVNIIKKKLNRKNCCNINLTKKSRTKSYRPFGARERRRMLRQQLKLDLEKSIMEKCTLISIDKKITSESSSSEMCEIKNNVSNFSDEKISHDANNVKDISWILKKIDLNTPKYIDKRPLLQLKSEESDLAAIQDYYLNIVLPKTKYENSKFPRPSILYFATRRPSARVRSNDVSQHPWNLDRFGDYIGLLSPHYLYQTEMEWYKDTLDYIEKKLEIEDKIKERPIIPINTSLNESENVVWPNFVLDYE